MAFLGFRARATLAFVGLGLAFLGFSRAALMERSWAYAGFTFQKSGRARGCQISKRIGCLEQIKNNVKAAMLAALPTRFADAIEPLGESTFALER